MTEPEIRSIRIFGTSWARRGPSYWLRRVGVTLTALLMLTALTSIYLIIASEVVGKAQGAWRTFAIAAFVLVAVWSVAASYYSYRPIFVAQRHRDVQALSDIVQKNRQPSTRAGRFAGLGLGASALAGSTLIGGLLVLGSVFVVGWPVVILYMSLRRYYTAEESLAALELEAVRRK